MVIVLLGVGSPAGVQNMHTAGSGLESSDVGVLSGNPKNSLAAELAVAMSYPLYQDGSKADPASRIPGGAADKRFASDLYKDLKRSAWQISVKSGNSFPAWPGEAYANCAAFTATAIIHVIDPNFPGNFTNKQREYLRDSENGWILVGESEDGYDGKRLQPGDIFLSKHKEGVMGHTWMWIGSHKGQQNVVAQASYAGVNYTAQLPALQIDPILIANKDDGTDKLGRAYEIWRYSAVQD